MCLFDKNLTPIGIDVGASSIKAIQLAKSRRGWRIQHALCFELPMPDTRLDSDAAARIGDVLKRHGFEGREIVLAAPGAKVEMDLLELPARSSSGASQEIARVRLAKLANVAPDNIEVACWPVGSPPPEDAGGAVIAVGVLRKEANQMLDAFEAVEFEVIALETHAWALARAAARLERLELPDIVRACVDIGWSKALLVITRNGEVLFQRTLLDSGMFNVQAAIMGRFDLDADIADQLIADSRLGPPPQRESVHEEHARMLLINHADRLARELKSSLSDAIHRYGLDNPIELLLSGGGARVAGLTAYLESALGIPARVHIPRDLAESREHTDLLDDPSMITAMGLAWHETSKP